ncbi:sarcosine oxidase subunit delta [Marinomonas primoryensis]|jgi:sarcosine oxidase subunit delta|uniref:Sarcosine oxidase subunit delta n=1 Tax=Marinomonas primoryensis TaxID=178399 RepID=A0A2Z4PV40_9GAMM|nr:sarcosine oxidase subunit delta family protein [Marinomonas primoryensis]AWY01257.1 sarcosine oxidase subunit delta [Marinomonas primoryensis]QKK80170.1 sarcosine oxidase subunit delta [Marinomonas primoryensis]|tara:strand:+ start:1613 stop:1963 length:351 start_codon:yes stop_codon:yes gene_type:complete
MFYIYCPHCCEHREEEEFHAAGQAHLPRPLDPDACTDKEWGEYIYFRKNPRGIHHELWVHAAGCRKFFNITRDTQTYEIKEVYKIGEQPSVVANIAVSSESQNHKAPPKSKPGATL